MFIYNIDAFKDYSNVKKIAKWLCMHKAVSASGILSISYELAVELMKDIGSELDMRHAEQLGVFFFDNEDLIVTLCKGMNEENEDVMMPPQSSRPSSSEMRRRSPSIELVEDFENEVEMDGASRVLDNSDSVSSFDVVDLTQRAQERMQDATSDLESSADDIQLIQSMLQDEENLDLETSSLIDEDVNQEEMETTAIPTSSDLPAQFPIAAPGFDSANAYNSRYNLYDYQRQGAVPPKLSTQDKYQRSIPDRAYKKDELRSLFDYMDLKNIPCKQLFDPEVVKQVFDAEDEFILKERIYYHAKTAEQLQLDFFKFGIPKREEYIFKYFQKSGALPLQFTKMNRLLAVVMFHSLRIAESEQDWKRVMTNFFIDKILEGGHPNDWMFEFQTQLFCNDALFFACRTDQLEEMKRRMKIFVVGGNLLSV